MVVCLEKDVREQPKVIEVRFYSECQHGQTEVAAPEYLGPEEVPACRPLYQRQGSSSAVLSSLLARCSTRNVVEAVVEASAQFKLTDSVRQIQ